MRVRSHMIVLAAGVGALLLTSPAWAVPWEVYSVDGPQDPLFIEGLVHELGDFFPPDEEIVSIWTHTDETACHDGSDDPAIPNILVEMTNLTGRDWPEVYYVADPETFITNFDGWIGNAGMGDAEEAFLIDWIGINTPLVFESMTVDNVFEAGETWLFIIQDFINLFGGPPTPFDSIGIASMSAGFPPSTGSIIAVPEPAALVLLLAGGLALVRRR